MPSCELPAMRMTASDTLEILGVPPVDGAAVVVSLMKKVPVSFKILCNGENAAEGTVGKPTVAFTHYHCCVLCQFLICNYILLKMRHLCII